MRSAPLPLAGYSASVLGVGDASRALGFLRVFPRPVKTGQRAQLVLGALLYFTHDGVEVFLPGEHKDRLQMAVTSWGEMVQLCGTDRSDEKQIPIN